MRTCRSFRVSGTVWANLFETELCGYGEGPPIKGHELPPRTCQWIDSVPQDLKVIVGHDVGSTDHTDTIVNSRGGAVTFLGTGCGKGGRLSWVDFD